MAFSMAKRALIRKGDHNTHGGTVLAGDPTFLIGGRELARVGDPVSCPQCRGTHVIVTGAPDVMSGQTVARHDDVTDCGAKLIASQHTATWSDESGGGSTAADNDPRSSPPEEQVEDAADVGEIRFQAMYPATGEPAAKCVYLVTREDGTQHGGVTDPNGFTAVIRSARPERVAVHFQFTAPDGKAIEREDLA